MTSKLGLLGQKINMTQLPSPQGNWVPVTAVLVTDNWVSQVKTEAKEGYNACQLAFQDCPLRSLNKPSVGHLNKQKISPKRHIQEIRDMVGYTAGSSVDLSIFQEGDKIKVSGISKGKGTAGVIKKYHFSRGRMTHGGGYPHRLIGSMGGGRGTNQGIPKGKKMPGRMGNKKVTISKVIVEKVDNDKKIIFLRGSIPGPRKSLVTLVKEI